MIILFDLSSHSLRNIDAGEEEEEKKRNGENGGPLTSSPVDA